MLAWPVVKMKSFCPMVLVITVFIICSYFLLMSTPVEAASLQQVERGKRDFNRLFVVENCACPAVKRTDFWKCSVISAQLFFCFSMSCKTLQQQLSLFVLLRFSVQKKKKPVSKELEVLLYLSLPFSILCLTFSARELMLIINSVTYFTEKTLNYDYITLQITRLCHIVGLHVAQCSFVTILLWFASVVAPLESVDSDHLKSREKKVFVTSTRMTRINRAKKRPKARYMGLTFDPWQSVSMFLYSTHAARVK